jgi:hypothetical protein
MGRHPSRARERAQRARIKLGAYGQWATMTIAALAPPCGAESVWDADVIITVIWMVMVTVFMLLMGMEIIHSDKVVDKLLISIPTISALIVGYWFNKTRKNGSKP